MWRFFSLSLAFFLFSCGGSCKVTSLESRGLAALPPAAGVFAGADWNRLSYLQATARILRYQSAESDDFVDYDLFARMIKDSSARLSPREANNESSGGIVASPPDDFWTGRFRPIFVKSIRTGNSARHFISLRNGGLLYTDDGKTFKRVRELPRRFTPPDYGGPTLYRDVEDLWQNPVRPEHLMAIQKHDLLESVDAGQTFRKMKFSGVYGNYTSLAGVTDAQGLLTEIWLGTSVNGIYRIFPSKGKIVKKRFKHNSTGIAYLRDNPGLKLYEEISGLVVDTGRKLVLATTLLDGALYIGDLPTSKSKRIKFKRFTPPKLNKYEPLQSLYYEPERARAYLASRSGLRVFELGKRGEKDLSGAWRHLDANSLIGRQESAGLFYGVFLPGPGRISVRFLRPRTPLTDKSRRVRALYISPTSARKKQKMVWDLLNNYRFNAAVIDVKDDFGRLVYGSKLPEAKSMRNHRERAPIRKLVNDLKAKGIYTIARMVVFKDKRLFAYKGSKYAIRDVRGGAWVGNEVERWVDSYSTWVQNYNIRVAQEMLAMGFDEIQFDYIRFPSDGPIGRCRWSYKKGDSYKSEALESFLRKARATLKAPISIDIYGYNGMYRVSGRVGQDLVDLGDYVDVVSPMHYSSHYGKSFLEKVPKSERTHELLEMGAARPLQMGYGRFAVRPWLQSFKLLTGRWGWGEKYMADQINGTLKGGGEGFLWWGPIKVFYLPGKVQKKMFAPSAR